MTRRCAFAERCAFVLSARPAERCAFVERWAFALSAKPAEGCDFVERCAFVSSARLAEIRNSDAKATTVTRQNNLRIMMRLGANQSENPAIREFARTTAPVEFMVASGVSDLGQPSKSRDFEEATSKSYPVAICRCFRSSLRCSNGSWCSKTAPRSRASNFPIEAAD